MTTQYLIRKVQTCPVCGGDKVLPNSDWQELNMAFDAWMKERDWVCMNEEAYAEWDRQRKEKFPFGEPPEEDTCGECEGEGKIDTWIPLQEAMHELAQGILSDDGGPEPAEERKPDVDMGVLAFKLYEALSLIWNGYGSRLGPSFAESAEDALLAFEQATDIER